MPTTTTWSWTRTSSASCSGSGRRTRTRRSTRTGCPSSRRTCAARAGTSCWTRPPSTGSPSSPTSPPPSSARPSSASRRRGARSSRRWATRPTTRPSCPPTASPRTSTGGTHGAVGPVKNQGSCGSCWSFSASGALEGANYLATGKMEVLSEQQFVDCDHECDSSEPDSCDAGCNGGLMTSAFSYLLKSGGLEREKDYPYTGKDGTCKFDKSKIVASVKNYTVVSVDEEQIAANLLKHGPLAIGINAAYMQTYIGGVSCPYICGRNLDHGVLLVGYGASGFAPSRLKNKPYWIIKNSWGENWGEQGYYKICKGSNVRNKCGVDSMVSTVSALNASEE
ncbi:hypothetical protein ACQ4PT_040672 [Festuca glaucescens]